MRPIIIAFALLLVGTVEANNNYDTFNLLKTIDCYIISLRNKDFPEAYYGYTSSEFRQETNPRKFLDFINKYTPLNNNYSIQLGSVVFNENCATYQGILTAVSGEQMIGEFQLLREATCWKIVNLTLYSL